jgi:hypothetical protein
MYRSTLYSYFHIILLKIMKIKHILLFLIILGIIYLEYLFYQNRLKYGNLRDFYAANAFVWSFPILFLFIYLDSNYEIISKISKILNIDIKNLLK